MLLRTITESTPLERFRQIEKALTTLGGNVDSYKGLDSDRLSQAIRLQETRARDLMRNSPFQSCMQDRNYGIARLTADALKMLREYKVERDQQVDLIEGLTYYRNVNREMVGDRVYVTGERCTYLGENGPYAWVNFHDTERKLKILEMLRHGADEDFSTMYLTMADGRPLDAQNGFVVEHLTESTSDALDLMEEYANTRWIGPWPWDINAPKKLRDMIKGEQQMRNARIMEMRNRFRDVYVQLMEGELEQAKVIEAGAQFVEQVQGMIEDLAKATGEILVTLRDQVRTEFGEEAAKRLETSSSAQIGIAVEALSALRAAMEHEMGELEQNIGQSPGLGGPGMGGAPGMDPMDQHAADAMAGAGGEPGMDGAPGAPAPGGDVPPPLPGGGGMAPEGERSKR